MSGTLAAQRLAVLLAGIRNVNVSVTNPNADLRAGSNTGQGNQGSANTAHMAGHAGTGADRLSVPRQLKNGATSLTGTV